MDIEKELYRPLLPKLGCNRNYPLLLRYCTADLMGLGLYNMYWEQGISKVEVLLTHGDNSTYTGGLIQSALEQHQLAVGTIVPLLSLPYEDHKHLTSASWITSLWEFISFAKIKAQSNDSPKLTIQRKHDNALLPALRNVYKMIVAEEVSVNRV